MTDNDNVIVLSSRDSNAKWNMFAEPHPETFRYDVRMLGRSLFPVHSEMTENVKYLQSCARRLYEALFIAFKRSAEKEDAKPINRDFVRFISQRADMDELHEFLLRWSGLTPLASYDKEHARYVYSTLFTTVNEAFRGDFAGSGDFSVREYMQDPQGRTLLLNMKSDDEAPIFRLLINCAIECALVNNEKRKFFLLDEFQQIPHLQKLGELVNTGSSYRARILCSLRSIAQLQFGYDRAAVEDILAGFPQVVAHRSVNRATIHFIRSKIGPVSEQKLQSMNAGCAHSILRSGWTSNFQVLPLEDPRNYLERVYAKIDNPTDYVLPVADKTRLIDFSGDRCKERYVDSLRYRPDYPILVVGGIGSGKTTTLKVFALQQHVNPDEPRVVFDFKGDWKEFYRA